MPENSDCGPCVPAFPVLSGHGHTRGGSRFFPLEDRHASFWTNARTALWQGLRALELKDGDRVLAPAYACGSEIDVLTKYGLHIDWYSVHADRTVNLESAAAHCKTDTRAFFFIHYFGMPQPIDEILEFCRVHNLVSIEDNAHGLFSTNFAREPLGSFGDISIFSVYKSLPVPDGGVLVVNSNTAQIRCDPVRPPLRFLLSKSKRLLDRCIDRADSVLAGMFRSIFVRPVAWLAKRTTTARTVSTNPASRDGDARNEFSAHIFDIATRDHGMSWVSRRMLRFCNPDMIIERRRENFEGLLRGIDSRDVIKPLITKLADGICPLFFPLQRSSSMSGFRSFMRENGVECHRFGFANPIIPVSEFELECSLKRDIICLPVHQSLGMADIDKIVDLVNQWGSAQP